MYFKNHPVINCWTFSTDFFSGTVLFANHINLKFDARPTSFKSRQKYLYENSLHYTYVYIIYYTLYMESFKNSRTFCVLNSVVTLYLKIEKNGEN
jgi:hypothetical protein